VKQARGIVIVASDGLCFNFAANRAAAETTKNSKISPALVMGGTLRRKA
jgi:hypothetical protein